MSGINPVDITVSISDNFQTFLKKIGAKHQDLQEGGLALLYEPNKSNLFHRKVVKIERIWDSDPYALISNGSSCVKACHRNDLFLLDPKGLSDLSLTVNKCIGAELIKPESCQPNYFSQKIVVLHPHRAVETTGSWTPSGNKAAFIGRLGMLETGPNRDGRYIVTLVDDNLSFLMSPDEFSYLKLAPV